MDCYYCGVKMTEADLEAQTHARGKHVCCCEACRASNEVKLAPEHEPLRLRPAPPLVSTEKLAEWTVLLASLAALLVWWLQ
jgi:hypothetical protein